MPPPRWPTPSTSPKPVTRARVGKLSVESAYVIGTQMLKPKNTIAEPMNAIARLVVPASATITLPITVITAPIESQCLRSIRSANATANNAQARNPNAPTAVIRPASGGGYLSATSIDVNPAEKPNTVTYARNQTASNTITRRTYVRLAN